ncbi:MAG: hypothetical protein WC554_01965 [Clostridia bacterium]|jgi:hypothetical protein
MDKENQEIKQMFKQFCGIEMQKHTINKQRDKNISIKFVHKNGKKTNNIKFKYKNMEIQIKPFWDCSLKLDITIKPIKDVSLSVTELQQLSGIIENHIDEIGMEINPIKHKKKNKSNNV